MRIIPTIFNSLSILSLAAGASDVEFVYWKELGLARTDLERFEQLVELPGLVSETIKQDPLLVLGIYAKNKEEQVRFARLYLRRELDRADRELGFFRVYADIYRTEHGNRPLINLTSLGISPQPSATSERLVLLIVRDCMQCDALVRSVAERVRTVRSLGADIYMVGVDDDSMIGNWADQLGLNPDLLTTQQITLNVGDTLANQLNTSRYPAIFKRRGDRLEKLSLSEHLELKGSTP